MRKTIMMILLAIFCFAALSGCSTLQYQPPEMELAPNGLITEPEYVPEETATEPEQAVEVQPEIPKQILDLQERTSKVKSLEFFYNGEDEGQYADVLSKRSQYKRYNNAVKLNIPRMERYMKDEAFDIVFLDLLNKKAYAYCEDLDYCNKMEKLKELDFDDYYFADPIDMTKNMVKGEFKKQEMFETNKQTKIFEFMEGHNKVSFWVWDFYGMTLQKSVEKTDGTRKWFSFDNIYVNKLSESDVYPPKDVRPKNFGETAALKTTSSAAGELADTETEEEQAVDEEQAKEKDLLLASVYGTDVSGLDCTPVRGGMQIKEDTKLCPGTYVLEAGISVFSDDITLDCNGAELVGANTVDVAKTRTGVYIRNIATGVVVRNCIIKNFARGIVIGSDGNIIYNNEITGNLQGIYMQQVDDIYYDHDEEEPNKLVYNNIYDNNKVIGTEMTYDFMGDSIREVVGNSNYWGTIDCNALRHGTGSGHIIVKDKKLKSTFRPLMTDTILSDKVGYGSEIKCSIVYS